MSLDGMVFGPGAMPIDRGAYIDDEAIVRNFGVEARPGYDLSTMLTWPGRR